jgi:hypothetical protein
MVNMTSCFIIMVLSFCLSICQGIIGDVQDALASSEAASENMVENHDDSMNMTEGNPVEEAISPITEWLGIFSLGMIGGLFAFNIRPDKRIDNQDNKTRSRNLIIAISILSVSVGIIHVLLVPEHSQESWIWGMIFLASGLAQIGFGIAILLVKKYTLRNILYYIGIIGNSMLVITFLLVRLVTPPFSPEGTPINELEPNGVITLIIEIILVILMAYQLKQKDLTKENVNQI